MAWVNLLDVIYPVGSFYISNSASSPASIIGGSWTQINGAVLRGYTTAGYVGSDTHKLTSKELPREYEVWLPNDRLADIGTTAAVDGAVNSGSYWGIHTQWLGGATHIQLCNALTTVLSGIEQRKMFGGGLV